MSIFFPQREFYLATQLEGSAAKLSHVFSWSSPCQGFLSQGPSSPWPGLPLSSTPTFQEVYAALPFEPSCIQFSLPNHPSVSVWMTSVCPSDSGIFFRSLFRPYFHPTCSSSLGHSLEPNSIADLSPHDTCYTYVTHNMLHMLLRGPEEKRGARTVHR